MANELIDNDVLGTDLATNAEGDLERHVYDLGTISGVANVVSAFVRELTTPYGYLGRFVYDVDGLKIFNDEYGNPAFYQLSEPVTPEWIENMIAYIQEIAAGQPRINLLGVDYEMFDLAQHKIRFLIRFEVLGTPKPFNLVLARENGTLQAGLEA